MKNSKGIAKRITIYFTIFIIVLIVTTLTATTLIFSKSFMNERIKLLQEKTSYMLSDFKNSMSAVRDFGFKIQNDTIIKTQLESEVLNQDIINKRIDTLINTIAGIKGAFIIDNEGNVLNKFYETYSKDVYKEMGEFFKEGSREEFFSSPNNFPYIKSDDFRKNQYITYISSIRNSKNFNREHNLFVSINKSKVLPKLKPNSLEYYDGSFIYSRKGELIDFEGTENEYVMQQAKELATKFNENGYSIIENNVYFIGSVPQYPEWIIVNSISMINLKKDIYYLLSVLFFVGGILILLGFVVSNIISKRITKPVLDLQNAMTSFVEGDMNVRVDYQSLDEIGGLVSVFNSMADEINKFVLEIYESGEEKKKAEISALKFQIESLQSQINPHFLYNTLNTVSYLAIKNRTCEIRELIQSLNILLRSTLSNQDELIPIRKEVEFLESYVKIQNYRYENIINLICNVTEDSKDILIPKLILQPLVENSLIHGIYARGEGEGHVYICIYTSKNGTDVIVADDGAGMKPEKIIELQKSFSNGGFNRIGLSNVNDRLKLYYNESLEIQTVEGVGTTISFHIPIKENNEVDNV